MNSTDIEIACSNYFDCRKNTIVPNISFGANFGHEIDLLIVSQSGYCTEVEIKISISDLKADFKKKHSHESIRIKHFFYAVPEKMKDKALLLIPEHAGLITIHENNDHRFARQEKGCVANSQAIPLTDKERINIGRLGCMRIWNLKRTLINKQNEIKQFRITNPSTNSLTSAK